MKVRQMLLCLLTITVHLSVCSCLIENLEDSDVRAVKMRLEEEKAKRLLMQNDLEILMVKVERLERNSHATAPALAGCPNGWITFEDSCYLFADEINVDWIGATHYCASHGNSHVATIESMPEELFLQYQANKLFKTGVSISGKFFWLGATDLEVKGVWVWYTNRKRVMDGYSNWVPGQGDGAKTSTPPKDCALLWGSDRFRWHDYLCHAEGHVICEMIMPDAQNK